VPEGGEGSGAGVLKFSVRTNWPGYPIGIILAFGGLRQDQVTETMERHGCSRETCLKEWAPDAIRESSQGHCAVFPCQRVLIWFSSLAPTSRTIAHECFHAAYGALPQLGIKLSDETEEVYAYAIDNLIGLVDDVIRSATSTSGSS
jgi:hypothetical protein